jgi:hypothetical protein
VFDAELPASTNQARSARQRLVGAMMNQPTSTQGLSIFTGSVFQQSPLICKHVFDAKLDINQTWLNALPSNTQTHNGAEVHLWQYDRELARWAVLPKYLQSTNRLVEHNTAQTVSTTDVATWQSVTKTYNETLPEVQTSYWEVFIDTTVFHDLWPHTRSQTVVQYPGLWDGPAFPYFDQQEVWDSNKPWDSGDVSNDIVLDGFIGTPINHETQATRTSDLGVSVIDRCVETTVISNSYNPTFFSIE